MKHKHIHVTVKSMECAKICKIIYFKTCLKLFETTITMKGLYINSKCSGETSKYYNIRILIKFV